MRSMAKEDILGFHEFSKWTHYFWFGRTMILDYKSASTLPQQESHQRKDYHYAKHQGINRDAKIK